jgi:hypothetical protein
VVSPEIEGNWAKHKKTLKLNFRVVNEALLRRRLIERGRGLHRGFPIKIIWNILSKKVFLEILFAMYYLWVFELSWLPIYTLDILYFRHLFNLNHFGLMKRLLFVFLDLTCSKKSVLDVKKNL